MDGFFLKINLFVNFYFNSEICSIRLYIYRAKDKQVFLGVIWS